MLNTLCCYVLPFFAMLNTTPYRHAELGSASHRVVA